MKQLVEAYKPLAIDGFVGLAKPKAILRRVADTPYESAWLFLGPSGTGKTTMALAFADTVGAEVHHIASKACDLETVNEVVRKCWYQPMFNAWHVVIVDEADQMSKPAQLAFLSKLDTTAMPPKTIFVFTANDTKAPGGSVPVQSENAHVRSSASSRNGAAIARDLAERSQG